MERKKHPAFILMILLCAVILLLLPLHALGEQGSCGAGLSWVYAAETLTVYGTGPMTDYGSADMVPWHGLRQNIRRVVVLDGVTSLGDYAFDSCRAVESIEWADSVARIGKRALASCAPFSGGPVKASSNHVWAEPVYTWDGSKAVIATSGCMLHGEERETETADVYVTLKTPIPLGKNTQTYLRADFSNPLFISQIKENPNAPTKIPGDANGDKVVDGRDPIRLMQFLEMGSLLPGFEFDFIGADADGDNAVNRYDLMLLMKYLGGEDAPLRLNPEGI